MADEEIDYGQEPTVVRDCMHEQGTDNECENMAQLTAVDNRPETVEEYGEGRTIDACLEHAAEDIWARGLDARLINAHVPAG